MPILQLLYIVNGIETVLGYTMVAMMASKCDIPYSQALKIMSRDKGGGVF